MAKYQINLDSNSYYSTETNTSHAHRVYAVDLSFLPEHKAYKMSFILESKKRTSNTYSASNNTFRVKCSFDGIFHTNIIGGATMNSPATNFIGILMIKRASNTGNDVQIKTFPHHNPPTYLSSRPTGNFITIEIVNTSGILAGTAISGSYLMTLCFEEID
jgi:hypothetical protein